MHSIQNAQKEKKKKKRTRIVIDNCSPLLPQKTKLSRAADLVADFISIVEKSKLLFFYFGI